LRRHIKYLSDDSLEGRGTGAKGGELAAQYIAAQLKGLGLQGVGANKVSFNPSRFSASKPTRIRR
jgi:hypothetical protein